MFYGLNLKAVNQTEDISTSAERHSWLSGEMGRGKGKGGRERDWMGMYFRIDRETPATAAGNQCIHK